MPGSFTLGHKKDPALTLKVRAGSHTLFSPYLTGHPCFSLWDNFPKASTRTLNYFAAASTSSAISDETRILPQYSQL